MRCTSAVVAPKFDKFDSAKRVRVIGETQLIKTLSGHADIRWQVALQTEHRLSSCVKRVARMHPARLDEDAAGGALQDLNLAQALTGAVLLRWRA